MKVAHDVLARVPWARKLPPVDIALAAVLAVLIPPINFAAESHWNHPKPVHHQGALAVVLMVAMAGAVAFRRRHTVAALAVVLALELIFFGLGYPNGPVWLPLIICYVTAAAYGHRLAAAVSVVIGATTIPWFQYLNKTGSRPTLFGILAVVAWLLVVLGVGEAIRIRRERAAAAARIEQEQARGRVTSERLRIARELHDSLGHYFSLISVQSAVALNLNPELPEQTRAALEAVKDASREGLRELRSALDVLRADGEPMPRSPTLTLAKLNELVARTTATGLKVRTQTEGDARPLPFGVDVAAYRIVQEALTNVTRHAGPATADVTVTYSPGEVTVQVDDDGRQPLHPRPAGGNGIAGMRERVTALGGELYAGPRPGGGFRVLARLPIRGAA